MKLVENFIQFLSNLTIDIRKSEMICGFLPVGLFSYVVLPEQTLVLRYVVYGYLTLLAGFFIFKITKFVMNHPIGKRYENIHIAELQDLAKKLRFKLPANPFRIVEKRNFLAGVILGNKILFGKDFLNNLSSDEKVFVGGHEFFHIYGHEELYISVTMIPMIFLISILSVMLNDTFLIAIICIGPLLVSMSLTKRSIESMADLYGAKYAGKDAAISALTKGYAAKKPTLFDFHPPLQTRIRNIEKHYSKV